MSMNYFDYWIAQLGDLGALLKAIAAYPFCPKKLDLPRSGPDILCIHGHTHNDSPWRWLRKKLQKGGMGPVNTVYYPSFEVDIPESSLLIEQKIQKIGRPVQILIGHSRGGLAALEYALEKAPKDRIILVITLGSPLQGTTLAEKGESRAVQQMAPHSPYLQSLWKRLQEAKHLRVLAIASMTDMVIRPPESALLPDIPYVTNVKFTRLGHLQMIYSKRVVKAILDYLHANSFLTN